MGNFKGDRKRSRAEAENALSASTDDQETGQSSKRAKTEERRSLFVRSLPASATNETLTELFSQYFPVKHAVVVVDQKTKESRGFGFVTLADADDAVEAKNTLDKKEWDGRRIRIDVAEPRNRQTPGTGKLPPGKPEKKEFEPTPKLIVRNLPWSIKTSDQLSQLFRSFGKVKFADLPQNKGKMKGFGFVTLRGKKNAEKALEMINGKEIDGRTLAVDWAVDKKTWDQQNGEDDVDEEEEDEDVEEDVEDEAEGSDVESDQDNEEGGAKTRDEALDADLENFMKNHMQNMEDEDDSDKEDEEKAPPPPKRLMTDNSSTVFIRNMPFTATDEQLKAFFTHFGQLRYARVVVDKITGKPAGTGFVCFVNGEDAKACIKGAPRPKQTTAVSKHSILQDESADPEGKYTLDGRLLQVAQAVNKEQATRLADTSLAERESKDKRKLFLLAEGALARGSPLFDVLTEKEIHMRQASAVQRKKLVQKNPSLHMSLTRLALRNIPRDIGSKELKELARKAIVGFAIDVREGRREPLSREENARDSKEDREREQLRKQKGKGIVRQAKVVFESTQGSKVDEKTGAGKSRGYGFIEYTTHHWALMGLRYLNGYQLTGDNGKKQRLIAEFAIENAQVVQRRREAETKAAQSREQVKNKANANEGDDDAKGPEASPAKTGRGKGKKAARGKMVKKGKKEPEKEDVEAEGAPSAKDEMKQKLIARTRLMRKKKAVARGKR